MLLASKDNQRQNLDNKVKKIKKVKILASEKEKMVNLLTPVFIK